MITENTLNAAAKAYAHGWNVDNGTRKIIIEAYKKGAIDAFHYINETINKMAKNNKL